MEDIEKILRDVYKAEGLDEIRAGILKLWTRYESLEKAHKPLSEKDIALITYGDQVYEGKEQKLSSLNKFLLRYLRDSFTIVHILPFYPYSSDDGFSVIDYYAVRQDLGNWANIKAISEHFTLMFDAVINHMSSQSDWFKMYLDGEDNFKNFFVDGSEFSNTEKVVRPRTSPLIHEFKNRKEVWTTFSRDQVDLDYRNPKVFLQILDLLLFYISKGASTLRLDAIGFLWKEDGTTCIHLPQTHAIIKALRKAIEKVSPSTLLITETNVPHQENISYFGKGDEAHLVYNFTLPPLLAFSILNETSSKLSDWAKTLNLEHSNTCFFNFLASHDGIGLRPVDGILSSEEIKLLLESAESNGGVVSYRSTENGDSPYEINCNYYSLLKGKDRNEELGIKRTILAHALLLSIPGLPAIYFHSMVGSENYVEGIEKYGYNRAVNREKLSLRSLEGRLNTSDSVSTKIYGELKRIISIRKKEPAFNPYAYFETLNIQEGVFGILRRGENKKNTEIRCYYNLTTNVKSIEVSDDATDLISGSRISAGVIELQPLRFIWLSHIE